MKNRLLPLIQNKMNNINLWKDVATVVNWNKQDLVSNPISSKNTEFNTYTMA